jgi:transposase
MNILLDKVVSDVTGVTGLKILEAILAGERNPQELAKLKNSRIQATEEEIAKAMLGDYLPEHLFVLKQSLDLYKYTRQQIIECDRQVEILLNQMDKKTNSGHHLIPPETSFHKKSQRNEPSFDIHSHCYKILGVDATQIPGFQTSTVQTLISEVGVDMSKWKTPKYFASWLSLCPKPHISGGKMIKNKTARSPNRASTALRRAAMSLSSSKSSLGSFYRRMRARIGAPKAITSAAHKLAVIYYLMVKNQTEYKELGEDYYTRVNKVRSLRIIKEQAKKLGDELVAQEG